MQRDVRLFFGHRSGKVAIILFALDGSVCSLSSLISCVIKSAIFRTLLTVWIQGMFTSMTSLASATVSWNVQWILLLSLLMLNNIGCWWRDVLSAGINWVVHLLIVVGIIRSYIFFGHRSKGTTGLVQLLILGVSVKGTLFLKILV